MWRRFTGRVLRLCWPPGILCCFVFVLLCLIPFYLVYSIANTQEPSLAAQSSRESETADLQWRVDDLNRIRWSVMAELRTLDEGRREIQRQLAADTIQLAALKRQILQSEYELKAVQLDISNVRNAHFEMMQRQRPDLKLPIRLPPPPPPRVRENEKLLSESSNLEQRKQCSMSSCFDWAPCSISHAFKVYLNETFSSAPVNNSDDQFRKAAIANPQIIFENPQESCLQLYLVPNCTTTRSSTATNSIFFVTSDTNPLTDVDSDISTNSIIASSRFSNHDRTFRPKFDVLLPPLSTYLDATKNTHQQLPSLLPVGRKYLLSFVCSSKSATRIQRVLGSTFMTTLRNMAQINQQTNDSMFIVTNCSPTNSNPVEPCSDLTSHTSYVRESEFSILVCAAGDALDVTRLLWSIRHAAIPVLLGCSVDDLPFGADGLLAWQDAVFFWPAARITEVHFVLKSFNVEQVIQRRRMGRLLFTNYMSSHKVVLDTVLSTVRWRLRLTAPVARTKHHRGVFPYDSSIPDRRTNVGVHLSDREEEFVGPSEPPFPSRMFQNNYTMFSDSAMRHAIWNELFCAHELHASLPWPSATAPSDVQQLGDSSFGYQAINKGMGGSGVPFSQALGGMQIKEQFTIVILTYKREMVLHASLARLAKLPYLNKVLVVWNNPDPPSPDIAWPELHVPLLFVRSPEGKNSLNNRFLPFAEIETDAVLSLDDDMHLTHAEMVFAFRVWRESRDRIVGFPGRFHSWENVTQTWRYNSNHSCELSMVLTGAAFFHKYYMHAYTYWMSSVIRTKVDEMTNCEDLAFNFLVAHLNRKPPIKVTSKWTFRCTECDDQLSKTEEHFMERHDCVKYFVQVYGYNPLKFTQFRADSVLFKTKLPSIHRKCYKYI